MGTINKTSHSPHDKVRSKKHSTHVDMTPMVDLAFLLLTFFILTAQLAKSHAMQIMIPEEPDESVPIPLIHVERVLTLVLEKEDKIYWYTGLDSRARTTTFAATGIRKILLKKNSEIKGMYVMIKPADASRYDNLVDILDEMAICGITRYAITEMTPEDRAAVYR